MAPDRACGYGQAADRGSGLVVDYVVDGHVDGDVAQPGAVAEDGGHLPLDLAGDLVGRVAVADCDGEVDDRGAAEYPDGCVRVPVFEGGLLGDRGELALGAVGRLGQRGAHLEAFFACLYYAALRPSEAVMLRQADLHLLKAGWGRIVLSASASPAGRAWTDEGTTRQERGLKHRADNETRTIPIPPVLVGLLRAHIKRFGATLDGQVFQTARGGILQDSGYNEVWDQARREALTPAQYRSPLGRRPYDLRHAAVSLWLNSGVPATKVARRAGHGVAVLLKIYAHCIDS
jgi:Phage integrase family